MKQGNIPLTSIFIFLFVTLTLIFQVFAIEGPPLPSQYYGVVIQDGNILSGKEVVVKDSDGNVVGVNVQNSDSEGIYVIHLMWDDPDTPEDEGVIQGEKIVFTIDGNPVRERTVEEQGGSYELDLDISGSGVKSGGSGGSVKKDNGKNESQVTIDGENADNTGVSEIDLKKNEKGESDKSGDVVEKMVDNEPPAGNVNEAEKASPKEKNGIKDSYVGLIITVSIVILGLLVYFVLNKVIQKNI